jgi:CheY-like chemotaxis protein
MEAQHLLRFFNEHQIARNPAGLSTPDGPLDYLRVTLRCRACSSQRDYALRDCVGIVPRCTCGAVYDSAGVEELITRVASIAAPARAPAGRNASTSEEMTNMKRHSVLLVEDDAASELLTVKCIHRSDISCDVHVARDGRQAVDFLNAATARRPDLILLDLSMPVMDGFEVLRVLRAEETFRHLPIVMLTTSNQPEAVEEAYDLGANGYVVKGPSLSKFRDDVAATLRYWLLASLRPPADSRTSSMSPTA